MDKLFNIKLNKFISKASYLGNELEEIELLMIEYNANFERDFIKEIEYVKKRDGLGGNNSNNNYGNNQDSSDEDEKTCDTKDIDVVFTNGAKPEDIGMGKKKKKKKKDDKNDEENDEENEIEDGVEDESDGDDKEKKPKKETLTDKLLRKLYRKIVIITHPDKNKISNDNYLRLFIKAEKANKEKNILNLMIIAMQLGIGITETLKDILDEKEFNKIKILIFNILESELKGLEYKITFKKKTFVWCWNEADTDEKKECIRRNLYQVWKLPDDFRENNI